MMSIVKKILVMEDEGDWREMLQRVLASRGYQVEAACSPDEGWNRATAGNPDLIIIDIIMPDAPLGGLDFAKKLAKDKTMCRIPRLFLTVVGMDLVHKQAASLSRGVFIKPLGLRDLLAKVDELLSTSEKGEA